MIHFIANLSFLFTELPFMDRFKAAAAAGFRGVEFLFPYDYPSATLKNELSTNNLELVLFNLPPGNKDRGEWGLLADPDQTEAFRKNCRMALDYAQSLGCHLLNGMFGQRLTKYSMETQISCVLENLKWAAPLLSDAGVTVLLEPLNALDFPNYGLTSTDQAMLLIETLGLEQVKLQLDLYHCLKNREDPLAVIKNNYTRIKHIQLADVPGRHQPGNGIAPFSEIFNLLEKSGYQGACGLEYNPAGPTQDSFTWMHDYDWY